MRRLLAWAMYWPGYALLALSERMQGDGAGPWGPARVNFSGNQFFDDCEFDPDGL